MTYLLPFEGIKEFVTIASVKGELIVSVSNSRFRNLIGTLSQAIEVDENWYVSLIAR